MSINEKKAILAVSFGTSRPDGMKAIEAVECELAESFPGREIRRAFTSPTIARILKGRGMETDDLNSALERLLADGFQSVTLLPTYIIEGIEYDEMIKAAEKYSQHFHRLRCAHALLYEEADFCSLAAAVMADIAPEDSAAYVFMGHGTEHKADGLYSKLEQAARCCGFENCFIGTVEGEHGIESICAELASANINRVFLYPLTLTAGVHAAEDMAGDTPDSWKSVLERCGFSVECVMQGLGEKAAVRKIFINRARACE